MAYARVAVPEFLAVPSRPRFRRELFAGVRAGQVAGLAMAGAMMALFSVFLQKSPFYPVEVIASAVLGEHVLGALDVRTIAVGLLVHQLGPSLIWGAVFGLFVWATKPRGSATLLLLGLLVGALAQVVDVYVVIPLLSGAWAGNLPVLKPLQEANLWAANVPGAVSWLGHLAFGVALSVYPWKCNSIARTFD